MKRNIPLWIGLIMCLFLFGVALLGPYLPFVDRELTPENYRYVDGKLTVPPYTASAEFPLGTDYLGRDMLSLLILGARETLWIVSIIVLVRFLIAIPLAIMASKQSGPMYTLLYGWNQLFSGLPTLFAAMIIINLPFVALSDQRTIWYVIIIALLEVGRIGYIFQQQAVQLSHAPFVEAGRMIGNSSFGIYRRYYFPYLLPQMIINLILDLGRVMLLIGQLGFFSFFISQAWVLSETGVLMLTNNSIHWPSLLADSRFYLRQEAYFWLPFYPAAAIAFSVIAFNILGEGLRQYFEGRSVGKYDPDLEQKVINEIKSNKMTRNRSASSKENKSNKGKTSASIS